MGTPSSAACEMTSSRHPTRTPQTGKARRGKKRREKEGKELQSSFRKRRQKAHPHRGSLEKKAPEAKSSPPSGLEPEATRLKVPRSTN